jgi:DNA-binding transcriptional MerR regulator
MTVTMNMRWFSDATVQASVDPFDKQANAMTISEMAETYGVTMRTLRYYEEKGFLEPKRVGNRRLYSERDQHRMATIVKGKRMGLVLEDIRELVRLKEAEDEQERIRKMLELCKLHREDLQDRQKELQMQADETAEALQELEKMVSGLHSSIGSENRKP